MLRTSRAVTALALTAAAVVATGAPAGAWRDSDTATRAVRNVAEAAPTWTLTVNVDYVSFRSDPLPMTMSRLTPTTAEGSEEADLPTPIELGLDTYTTTRIVNEKQGDVEALTICVGGPEPACTSFGFFFAPGDPFTSKWWVQAWGSGNAETLDPINYLPYYDYKIGDEASMSVYASGAHTLQIDIGT